MRPSGPACGPGDVPRGTQPRRTARPPRPGGPPPARGARADDAPATELESDRPERPSDLVAVGRVVDAYGIRGWVKVAPYNDPADSVLRWCRRWWFEQHGPLAIDGARVHGATVVCKPRGSEDRDAALRLRNAEILVSRSEFPRSDPGEFYWVDLVGCRVVSPGGDELGTVTSVEDFGAHPILKVGDGAGRELLVPFVGAWIVSVDLAGRRIVADWQPDY